MNLKNYMDGYFARQKGDTDCSFMQKQYLHMCVITSLGVTIAAQDMLINESLRLMTSNVQYEEYGQGAGGQVAGGILG